MTDKNVETTENPLLKKIKLPGRRFRLPSRGLFYNDGELADTVIDGEIEVFSMTTIDEINLRSSELLFSGEAIEKTFKRCIPEVKKPFKLLSVDVDFLLGCLRVVSYGNILDIKTRCPKCEERQVKANEVNLRKYYEELKAYSEEKEIDFDELKKEDIHSKRIDAIIKRRSPEQTFNINLFKILQNKTIELDEAILSKYEFSMSNGDVIKLKPITLENAVHAYQIQNDERLKTDSDFVGEYLSFVIAAAIDNVNDVHETHHIIEWAKELPVKLKTELTKKFETLEKWGTDFDYTLKCQTPECGHEWEASALLNPVSFFTQPSE